MNSPGEDTEKASGSRFQPEDDISSSKGSEQSLDHSESNPAEFEHLKLLVTRIHSLNSECESGYDETPSECDIKEVEEEEEDGEDPTNLGSPEIENFTDEGRESVETEDAEDLEEDYSVKDLESQPSPRSKIRVDEVLRVQVSVSADRPNSSELKKISPTENYSSIQTQDQSKQEKSERFGKSEFQAQKTESPSRQAESQNRKSELQVSRKDSPTRKRVSSALKTESPIRKVQIGKLDSPVKSTLIRSPKTQSPARKTGSGARKTESTARKIESTARKTESPARTNDSHTLKPKSPVLKTESPSRKIVSPVRSSLSPARSSHSPTRSSLSPARSSHSPTLSSLSPARRTETRRLTTSKHNSVSGNGWDSSPPTWRPAYPRNTSLPGPRLISSLSKSVSTSSLSSMKSKSTKDLHRPKISEKVFTCSRDCAAHRERSSTLGWDRTGSGRDGSKRFSGSPRSLGKPIQLWEIQRTLGRGDFIEGVLNVDFSNGLESYICAPIQLGRSDGHLQGRVNK